MNNSPRFETVVGHRVPVEVARDPPFRLLAEAYEGRSKAAIRNDQTSSSCKERQQLLNLVKRRVPKSDILSLVATIDAAIFHYDRVADIQEADFEFLGDLLSFLKEFGIVEERRIASVAEELKARINSKAGSFENYLRDWDQRSQAEAFEREAIRTVEMTERMHANKKAALTRLADRKRRQEQGDEAVRGPPLGEELQNREPEADDLKRLCAEERSLVHSLKSAGDRPINWLALAGETFRNKLIRRDYERLTTLDEQEEQGKRFHTPPGSPMH
jgi:hypothetical protein